MIIFSRNKERKLEIQKSDIQTKKWSEQKVHREKIIYELFEKVQRCGPNEPSGKSTIKPVEAKLYRTAKSKDFSVYFALKKNI